jgi:hypothetical protein
MLPKKKCHHDYRLIIAKLLYRNRKVVDQNKWRAGNKGVYESKRYTGEAGERHKFAVA